MSFLVSNSRWCFCTPAVHPTLIISPPSQQISRSTLIGDIYSYQLFITFNRILFKNVESLVFCAFFGDQVLTGCVLPKSEISLRFFFFMYLWLGFKKRSGVYSGLLSQCRLLPILFSAKRNFKGIACLPQLKNDGC